MFNRQPRPNVRIHPLDVHALPQRLRGEDVQPDEYPEAVIAYLFAIFVVLAIVGTIIVMAES